MADTTDIGPLDWRIAITDKNGRPTPEFQRRWNSQRSNNALIGTISFGSGPPPSSPPPADGAEYADTSSTPYVIYVGNGGVWNKSGVSDFTELLDVPHTYTGSSNYVVRVNVGMTALEFVNPTANPTATAGATAVPGTALTFMRSDAAPAVQIGSAASFGIVKADGTSVLASAGVISVPTATAAAFGIMKPDNTTITITGGVISAVGGGGGGFFTPRPPTTAQFPLSNLGTSVTTSVQAGTKCYTLTKTDVGSSGNDRVGFQGKAVPTGTSWTATAILQAHPTGNSAGLFYRTGLGILENSTGKTTYIGFNTQSGVFQISCHNFSNLNTFTGTLGSDTSINFCPGYPIYFQINRSGTTYTFSVSYDYGLTYLAVATMPTSTFTADRIGLTVETFGTCVASTVKTHCVYYSDPDIP